MILAPHFVTSPGDFGYERRETAGDVTVATSSITSPGKNGIKGARQHGWGELRLKMSWIMCKLRSQNGINMNKQKLLRILLVLFILLAVIFGILLIMPDTRGNLLGRIGLWCGLLSQLLLAVVMYSEIRRLNKREEK